MLSLSIRLGVKCPGCDDLVPVNGMASAIKCARCAERIPLEDKYNWWKILAYNTVFDVFTKAVQSPPGTELTGVWGSVKMSCMLEWPACMCGHRFEEAEVAKQVAAASAPLTCSACSKTLRTERAAGSFLQSHPSALWVIGGRPADDAGGPGVEPKAAKPVVMACMSCGASLSVDGSTRTVECEFCAASNYLPDGLWLSLHPAPKRERWWVFFDPKALKR